MWRRGSYLPSILSAKAFAFAKIGRIVNERERIVLETLFL
jgi:hypothetical protein